jgi:membrane protein
LWGKIVDMSVVDRIEASVDRAIDAARRRSTIFDHIWRALVRFSDVLGGRLAAAISYYAFFAAFSLAVLAYSILGRLLDAGALVEVNDYLRDSLPWVADTAAQVGRGEVTVLAAIALLISGIGWVESLRSSLRAIWLLDQHPGHWLLRRLVDLGMLVGLGVLLLLSLAMTSGLDRLLGWIAPDTDLGETLLRPFGPALEFVVNLVLACAMLTAVSRMHLSLRRLIGPALVIAIGIQLLNTAGRALISLSEDRPVYAVVTNAVGLLIYLYVLNQVILFGAALAATASAGKARDLGAGAAGIARGRVLIARGPGNRSDSAGGFGEPHRSPNQMPP